jgi:hypothetical protein
MHVTDGLAVVLVVAAAATFLAGELALGRADDPRAVYWLCVGSAFLWSAVQVARSGTRS